MKGLPTVFAILGTIAPAFAQGTVPRAPVLSDFGTCVARQSTGLARALLATEMGSPEERRRAHQLFRANTACMDGRAVLSSRVGEVRGTVAEALLEREPDVLARLSRMPSRPAARADAVEGRRFVAAYARCLADAEPAKATALLATGHHSPEERDAMLAFGDTLNDCMPMGVAYRVDRFNVRNHIAARLYEVAFSGSSEGER